MFKGRYGDEGKQKDIDLMKMSLNDPTSPIEESDMDTLLQFIEDNWK